MNPRGSSLDGTRGGPKSKVGSLTWRNRVGVDSITCCAVSFCPPPLLCQQTVAWGHMFTSECQEWINPVSCWRGGSLGLQEHERNSVAPGIMRNEEAQV